MTVRLLLGLGELRASPVVLFVATVIVIVLLPLTLLADVLRASRRAALLTEATSADVARCAGGHEVPLHGAFACSACGRVELRQAWSPCSCGSRAEVIRCPCGRSVNAPLDWEALP